MRIKTDEQGILLEYGVNRLRVQPWGPDGIRVMMVRRGDSYLVPHGSMPLEVGDRLVIIMGDSDD